MPARHDTFQDVLKRYVATRVASALLALVVALIGVQASSPRCPANAPCCPQQESDQPSDELVNPLPPCCDHIIAKRISVQPTTRSEGIGPLVTLAVFPALALPPLRSNLSRPVATAPPNLQSLYKRKCVLLL